MPWADGRPPAQARPGLPHAHRRDEPVRHDQLDLHLVQPAGRRQRRRTCGRDGQYCSQRNCAWRQKCEEKADMRCPAPKGASGTEELTASLKRCPDTTLSYAKSIKEQFMATTTQPATGDTTKQLINYRTDAGVAVIEMNDPPANTYTYEMNRALDEAILKARMDNDVHVIVLTGAGDKFFSAGANIKMLASVDPVFKYYFCLHANETLLRLEQTPKLCIAAINGHAVGGGFEVALACDMRIAREGAFSVGLPEVNLGVLPGTGGTQRLSRLIGKSQAIEMMCEGKNFELDQALAM